MKQRFTAKAIALSAAIAFGVATSANAQDCAAPDNACEVPTGSYFAALPDGPPKGAVMFLHGFGSSGAGSLSMSGMVRTFTEAGLAVIAPNGTPREGRNGRTWSFHPDRPAARDELPFLASVKKDAATRFGFDPDTVMLSGFSIGGSMVSYVACFQPDLFAAYAPVAGGMWRPQPQDCAGPVRLMHTHGWNDGVVPLEGRTVRGADAYAPDAFVQGDVFHSIALWRETNDCRTHDPDARSADGLLWRRDWSENCAPGSSLSFVMHPGGHAVPNGWAEMALEWFEAQTALN
ncbi:polyhydroxybutyrate depolymerase [Aliishimia ponticola]|uniref:Polyhydroxybutyrate depolymerase n=1 Tax=Aliishimia ponticola TaxID=2499833 RepID=A0A4V3XK82_9RHOB|nr:PHB depolymerase family esterase [Aliishimia ponticola]THH35983.1 polyhydroxybutyrate depolymerase [Aliishimia ponticola]